MIYLDNAATTQPASCLQALFAQYCTESWHNPSAMYLPAVQAEQKLDAARTLLKNIIHAQEAIFTSCGTEGSNTVIFNGWQKRGSTKRHFITSAYEHPCVYECFRQLEQQGHRVDFVKAGKSGIISPETVAELVCEDTALVAIMHVNNETGAVNDICAIADAVKAKNPQTVFYADGVQAFLRVPFDMMASKVDYYTASAHKVHGLKGTGILFFKKGTPLKAYLLGGGQENTLRSGTENTFGILAFAEAAHDFLQNHAQKLAHMAQLKHMLCTTLMQAKGAYCITPECSAPHILNMAFEGMRGEVLLHLLEKDGICIATGSACSSKKRSFRVHESVGLSPALAECAVRFSFCPDNTPEEIQYTAQKTIAALQKFPGFIRR